MCNLPDASSWKNHKILHSAPFCWWALRQNGGINAVEISYFHLDGWNHNSRQDNRTSVRLHREKSSPSDVNLLAKRNLFLRLQATVCSSCWLGALTACRDWKMVTCFSIFSVLKACLHFGAASHRQGCPCAVLAAPACRTASAVCAVRPLSLAGSDSFRGLQWVPSEVRFVWGCSLDWKLPPPLPEARLSCCFRIIHVCVTIPVCLPQEGLTGAVLFSWFSISDRMNCRHNHIQLSAN